MCRLTLRMVRSTLVTAWFLADWPTRTSPFLAKATTEGVVREPSEFAMTVGSPPSRTVTTELVVPRSIPTARAMEVASLPCAGWCCAGPVVGGTDLASGPLNFPAQPNGTPATCVPPPREEFSAGSATISSADPDGPSLTLQRQGGTAEVREDEYSRSFRRRRPPVPPAPRSGRREIGGGRRTGRRASAAGAGRGRCGPERRRR